MGDIKRNKYGLTPDSIGAPSTPTPPVLPPTQLWETTTHVFTICVTVTLHGHRWGTATGIRKSVFCSVVRLGVGGLYTPQRGWGGQVPVFAESGKMGPLSVSKKFPFISTAEPAIVARRSGLLHCRGRVNRVGAEIAVPLHHRLE